MVLNRQVHVINKFFRGESGGPILLRHVKFPGEAMAGNRKSPAAFRLIVPVFGATKKLNFRRGQEFKDPFGTQDRLIPASARGL